jgi:hypothetical protein
VARRGDAFIVENVFGLVILRLLGFIAAHFFHPSGSAFLSGERGEMGMKMMM